MVLDGMTVVTCLGWASSDGGGRAHKWLLDLNIVFCFVIWLLITQVCSLYENSLNCTPMICVLFYMHVTYQ